MTATLRTPIRRIVFAIALSALAHAVILWLPHWQLPHGKVPLPPLTARLELMPKPVVQMNAKTEPVNQVSQPADSSPAKPVNNTAYAMKEMKKSAASRQFPKHLRLTFIVYKGADFFRSGELRHQLDIHGNRYILTSVRQAAGPTSQLVQTSHGRIDEHGLRPDVFQEEAISANGQQRREATFDWAESSLNIADGDDTALPADTQDILSFMYQLAQFLRPPIHREFFPMPITDGAGLENAQIEIGSVDDISTPMGGVRALHLRKMHEQGEPYFEIWLGLEYRSLPVKFRQVDGSDNVTEEFTISDIRASDE